MLLAGSPEVTAGHDQPQQLQCRHRSQLNVSPLYIDFCQSTFAQSLSCTGNSAVRNKQFDPPTPNCSPGYKSKPHVFVPANRRSDARALPRFWCVPELLQNQHPPQPIPDARRPTPVLDTPSASPKRGMLLPEGPIGTFKDFSIQHSLKTQILFQFLRT